MFGRRLLAFPVVSIFAEGSPSMRIRRSPGRPPNRQRGRGPGEAIGAADVLRRRNVHPGDEHGIRELRARRRDGVENVLRQHSLLPGVLNADNGDWPETTTVSSMEPTARSAFTVAENVPVSLIPVTLESVESGQGEADGIDARPPLFDAALSGAIVTTDRTFSISAGLAARPSRRARTGGVPDHAGDRRLGVSAGRRKTKSQERKDRTHEQPHTDSSTPCHALEVPVIRIAFALPYEPGSAATLASREP